jgi:hypothetical protein
MRAPFSSLEDFPNGMGAFSSGRTLSGRTRCHPMGGERPGECPGERPGIPPSLVCQCSLCQAFGDSAFRTLFFACKQAKK